MVISGESGEVSGKRVDLRKEQLPEIIEGYEPVGKWNMDDSGVSGMGYLTEV